MPGCKVQGWFAFPNWERGCGSAAVLFVHSSPGDAIWGWEMLPTIKAEVKEASVA